MTHHLPLADIIYKTREDTILNNYNAAVIQLKGMIEKNPFQETFVISSGCISDEMTTEITRRFNQEGVKAIVNQGGMMTTQRTIVVNAPIIEHYN